eukprot:scaffold215149_cov18-Prasinocladus_malaysianus.AAC.1
MRLYFETIANPQVLADIEGLSLNQSTEPPRGRLPANGNNKHDRCRFFFIFGTPRLADFYQPPA